MGLDMYLIGRCYFSPYNENDKELGEKIQGLVDTLGFRPQALEIEVGYWRKANAIHDWFVKNIQSGEDDCRDHYLSRVDAQKLLDTVNQVLADNSKAPELLPTASGFFFGSTDYDERYIQDLEETKTIMENVINKLYNDDKTHWEIYYQSSW